MTQQKAQSIVGKALLDNIKSLLRTGDFNKAEQQLLNIVAAGSDDAEVFYMLAVSQRYLKKYPAALSNLHKLTSLVPDHSRGHQETGHTYKAMNELDAALNAYSHAIQINPAMFASLRGQIEILSITGKESLVGPLKRQLEYLEALPKVLVVVMDLIAHGKLIKAEELCSGFLQEVPRHVEGMRLLADIVNRLGNIEDAESLLESAVEISPDSTQVRIDYIHVLRKRQKHKKALAQAKFLLAKDSRNPQFQSVFAYESIQLGDYSSALLAFDSILEIIPEDPVTLTSRGTALKTTGQLDKAIDSYRRAIKEHQGHGEAYYSLANLKLFSFSEEEIVIMEAQVGSLGISHMSRVYINFALGKAYEDKGLFEKSFEHYELGNSYKKAQSRYKSNELTNEFQAQADVFDDAFVARHSDTGHDAPDPIFIVGLPRAGSTLLEQILASHSQVDGTMELPNMLSLAQKLRRGERMSMTNHYPAVLTTLEPQSFAEFGETFIKETRIHRGSAPFFIDKMPNNFRHIGLIRLMLPNAKIIDARRHPMGCCFSGFKQLFAEGQEFTYGLEDIGTYYKDYVELMDHWDKVFPGKILRVQYEDVVTDLNTQVRRILDYCGLDFEESCISFYENERSVRTPSSEQVRQPIYQGGVEQWRNFEDYLGPLKDSLGPVLGRYPI
jgi:tetratricopeptide (TPR) repeat protein